MGTEVLLQGLLTQLELQSSMLNYQADEKKWQRK